MENEHSTSSPKRDFCLQLLEKHGVKDNILSHSLKVNEVAVFLGNKLVSNQELIDLQLLDRASLLHDLGKAETLNTQESHSEKGFQIMSELGYPKIARAIRHHRLAFILESKFNGWEDLLVFYADKRVLNNQIVTIEEIFKDLKERYGNQIENIEKAYPKVKDLERQLFEHLNFYPEDLKNVMELKIEV